MKWPIDIKYGIELDDVMPLPSLVDTTGIRVRNQKGLVSAEEWTEYIRQWHKNNPKRNRQHQQKWRQTHKEVWAARCLPHNRTYREKQRAALYKSIVE